MDPSRAELQEKIKAQGDIVRKLKSEKVEKSLVRNNNEIFLDKIFHHFQNNLNSILIKVMYSNCYRKKRKCQFYYLQDISSLVGNLKDLNDHLMTSSYIGGQFSPTILDCQVLNSLNDHSKLSEFPHISRWVSHIQSFNKIERSNFDQAPALQINQPQDLKSRVRRRCMWRFRIFFFLVILLQLNFSELSTLILY